MNTPSLLQTMRDDWLSWGGSEETFKPRAIKFFREMREREDDETMLMVANEALTELGDHPLS